jgi:hypothetical protein
MNDLAVMCYRLGRHADALAMKEGLLQFNRRVMPEDHPSIGEGHVWSGAACEWPSLVIALWFRQVWARG